jgi:lipid A 3-O-deacylase
MRLGWLAGIVVLAIGSTGVAAADLAATPSAPPTLYAPAPKQAGFVSELRFGVSAHDPWSPEKGSANITGEVLFAKPFTAADLFWSYFIPRPHIGGSINTGGDTSFGYAGLTWTVDLTERVFVEASFGGAVHNGDTGRFTRPGRSALGCSPLFRESASVGVRLSANWSVMATVEHLSNAGACSQNRGLTNVGARIGYTF